MDFDYNLYSNEELHAELEECTTFWADREVTQPRINKMLDVLAARGDSSLEFLRA